MFVCNKCGAVWAKIGSGFCDIPVDGGGTCRGEVHPSTAQAAADAVAKGLPARVGGSQGEAGQEGQAQRVLTSSAAAAKALASILGRTEMQAGGTYPGGATDCKLLFRDADDRAEFANALLLCGGKVGP